MTKEYCRSAYSLELFGIRNDNNGLFLFYKCIIFILESKNNSINDEYLFIY